MSRFSGKVALITGGGSGIGRAACVAFAEEGAKVAVVDLNLDGAQETARTIEERNGEALAIQADVAKAADAERLAKEAVARFGRIDILFNNAGIAPRGTILDTPEETWDRVMAVDLKSIFLVSRHVVPIMKQNGGGAIVNTGSMCSVNGIPNLAAYTAAKGGVLLLTKQMAAEFRQDRIRVNCVCPGGVLTPMTFQVWRDQGKDPAKQDTSRMQKPEEIAEAVLFFASDAARQISGEYLVINGLFSYI